VAGRAAFEVAVIETGWDDGLPGAGIAGRDQLDGERDKIVRADDAQGGWGRPLDGTPHAHPGIMHDLPGRALRILKREGLVTGSTGHGTFVAEKD
jgi:hypothetical protein